MRVVAMKNIVGLRGVGGGCGGRRIYNKNGVGVCGAVGVDVGGSGGGGGGLLRMISNASSSSSSSSSSSLLVTTSNGPLVVVAAGGHNKNKNNKTLTTTTTTTKTTAMMTTRTTMMLSRRHRSTSHQYEYPLRSETPVVTRSRASSYDAAVIADDECNDDGDESNTSSSSRSKSSTDNKNGDSNNNNKPSMRDISRLHPNDVDHFDDRMELSNKERREILLQQHSNLETKLSPFHKITPIVPKRVPSNIPMSIQDIPSTQITTLEENGLRIASQETYGQVSTIGLLTSVGSRYETDENTGVNHLMELLAFQSTNKHPHASDIVSMMDQLGGSTFASSSREQFLYCVDILRPNVEYGVDLLSQTFINPQITNEEVDEMKKVMEYQYMDMLPEIKMGEGLQIAAYKDSQLGRPHICPPEKIHHLNSNMVHEFRSKHFNPNETVLAGAGIEHELLVELGQKYFSSMTMSSSNNDDDNNNKLIPSTYTGGEYRLQTSSIDGNVRVALAFEVGGWHSTSDLVPSCVLQILLGGGSSFSAGGPGKGMYSRLYREVLNKYHWVESCECFASFHSETGLFGISGSTTTQKTRDLTRVMAEHVDKLGKELVSDEELDRAKQMLKCNVLTQLESRLVLFEDIGRQILTYGERENSKLMCERIDNVTKEDLRNLMSRALGKKKNPPTLSTVGDDLSNVPTYEEVSRWFHP